MAKEIQKISQKNLSIETLRYIAAFAVICIHFFYPKDKQLTLIINQWARFAVPFFFVASGYFLSQKLKKNDAPPVYWNYVKKVLILYIAWQFIYFINPNHYGEIYIRGWQQAYLVKLNKVILQNWDIMLGGWAPHLWFFESLALTVCFFFLFRLKRVYGMLVLGIIFYVLGCLTKAYVKTKIGIPVSYLGLPKTFNSNYFICASALPFTLGVLISKHNIHVKWWIAFIIIIVGYALHFTEVWYLGTLKLHQRIDYGFSTFILGVGVFLLGLSRVKILESGFLAKLGGLSLGIYAIHVLTSTYIYDFIVMHFKEYKNFLMPPLILIFSTLISWGLSKIPVVKKLVS